jgi:hypothetical protein
VNYFRMSKAYESSKVNESISILKLNIGKVSSVYLHFCTFRENLYLENLLLFFAFKKLDMSLDKLRENFDMLVKFVNDHSKHSQGL